jgi:hypothetical protein
VLACINNICLSLLCFCLAGCTFAGETPVTLAVVSPTNLSPTVTETRVPVHTITPTPTATLSPTHTFTPTPAQFVLPVVTMSPHEVEQGLLELLKTNGDCTGKCTLAASGQTR